MACENIQEIVCSVYETDYACVICSRTKWEMDKLNSD
jgi:hypothetical protein